MWDDMRKVGVLNDFDLARFADQRGASGQGNTGTLPFMALDLLSERGLRGVIPRRYRHETESFTWCLIRLYFATAEDSKGQNRTRDPHPLRRWFTDWESSRDAKRPSNGMTMIPLGPLSLTRIRESLLVLSTTTGWIGTRNNSHAPHQLDSWTLTLRSQRRKALLMKSQRMTVYSRRYWSGMRTRCMQNRCGTSGMICSRSVPSTRKSTGTLRHLVKSHFSLYCVSPPFYLYPTLLGLPQAFVNYGLLPSSLLSPEI